MWIDMGRETTGADKLPESRHPESEGEKEAMKTETTMEELHEERLTRSGRLMKSKK